MNRFRQHEAAVLAFALQPDIPFTNNQAERDLRPAKVKVSGCFRKSQEARIYARLQAAISTFRKQGMNIMDTLHAILTEQTVTV